jgi:hypothetical protein
MEKAFSGPYVLKQRLGGLDAVPSRRWTRTGWMSSFAGGRPSTGFPGSMAKRVQALWHDRQGLPRRRRGVAEARDGDDLTAGSSSARLRGHEGEDPTRCSPRATSPAGWEKHAASWHTVADVDSEDTMAAARQVKREMKAAKTK